MDGRGRAGQIVNAVDLKENRHGHVMADAFEFGSAQEVAHVTLGAGEKIVEANHIMAAFQQPVTQMRPQKTRPACHQNSHDALLFFRAPAGPDNK